MTVFFQASGDLKPTSLTTNSFLSSFLATWKYQIKVLILIVRVVLPKLLVGRQLQNELFFDKIFLWLSTTRLTYLATRRHSQSNRCIDYTPYIFKIRFKGNSIGHQSATVLTFIERALRSVLF